jgi:L-2-hydroxyglutarate oxidase
MTNRFEVAVIGGGIVGLSTARALLESGVRRVVVLEAEASVAEHQSGRNSGVVHSGLYYRPGSLKAKNCIAGRDLMYRYCEENGIPHRRSGKIVVATRESELPRLEALRQRGTENGLEGLRRLDRDALREIEPEVDGIAGIHVKEAGIADYRAVSQSFAADVRTMGGEIRLGARVVDVRLEGDRQIVVTEAGDVDAEIVVNCAGLHCDRIAKLFGVEPGLRIVPFRGEYFDLRPEAAKLINNPIYPVPDPAFPFLGVHLTPTTTGTVEAGPNAVLAFAREGYRKTDVSLRDLASALSYPGFQKLAMKHWRFGWDEMVRSVLKGRFAKALQRLVPAVQADDLLPGKAGIRAQAVAADGSLLDDFKILHGARSVHVLNAPSPAATASISIGGRIARHIIEESSLRASA